jgi:hypothetical protein
MRMTPSASSRETAIPFGPIGARPIGTRIGRAGPKPGIQEAARLAWCPRSHPAVAPQLANSGEVRIHRPAPAVWVKQNLEIGPEPARSEVFDRGYCRCSHYRVAETRDGDSACQADVGDCFGDPGYGDPHIPVESGRVEDPHPLVAEACGESGVLHDVPAGRECDGVRRPGQHATIGRNQELILFQSNG